ncbi:FAD-binding protein [Pacificoceanicola onchidii]|uniref:FAD-binding protein n=1 Tax=Pacificoceanicola onchidii TaxID=2562685 RepID=UPI0010A5D607|nr:FAD-binding protein [Pacificoceanicola onchidii]
MKPETEAALAEMISAADGPLFIRGGGSRDVAVAGAVLETGGLRGITLYDPGSLTLVVKAGTPLDEIEAALEAEGQRLAFEPMDHRGLLGTSGAPSIGGVVAGNISGPRRIQAGACRDFLLGVRFVDGMGQIIKNGGRVMKNVTGYDLVKLMAGSWGTLGVLTEVSLKVLPKPEAAACLLIHGLQDAEAVAAMSKALGSPFDVTGAAHTPSGVDGHPVTMIRIEGFEGSVSYRAKKLREMFADRDVRVETEPARVSAGWRWVRDVEPMHGSTGDVWRVSMKPSDTPDLVQALRSEGFVKSVLYDWGGGLVWIETEPGKDIRTTGLKGHATLVRASDAARARIARFQPELAPVAALSDGIRCKFDPRGILNPGVMTQ